MASNIAQIFIGQVSGGNVQPITTGSYDLRVTPFSTAGISGTHTGNGMWNFTGIDDTAEYKLYDTSAGTEWTAFTGGGTNTKSFYDSSLAGYIKPNGTVTFTANQPMGGFKITGAGAGTANGDLVRWEQTVRTTGVQSIDDLKTFNTIPKLAGSRSYSGSNREVVDIGYLIENYGTGAGTSLGININRLVVDSKQTTDIVGKMYNGIQEAITYASSQTPSSTSRWTIYILPHHSSGYAEDITIPQYVDLIGWGQVYITGSLTTTHVTAAQTWSARDARIENLIFNSTDKTYRFRLLHIKDCIAKANGAAGEVVFYIDGCNMRNFGVFTQNDVDLQANATEQENRATGCFGNEEPVWESGDDVGSFTLLNSLYEF